MRKVTYVGGVHVLTEPGEALACNQVIGHLFMTNGQRLQVKRAWANITASQTDAPFIPGVANATIRIIALTMLAGGTATNLTFNSYPSGGPGVACSPLFANGANGGAVVPRMLEGWIQAAQSGDGITITTGAGSTTGVIALFIEIPDDLFNEL